MNEAVDLLADLRSRGVELETDGGRLRWRIRGETIGVPFLDELSVLALQLTRRSSRRQAQNRIGVSKVVLHRPRLNARRCTSSTTDALARSGSSQFFE